MFFVSNSKPAARGKKLEARGQQPDSATGNWHLACNSASIKIGFQKKD
jgi:hypothetical protein